MSNWANVAKLSKAKTLDGGLLVHATGSLPFLLEEGMEVHFVPPVLRVPRTGRVIQIDHKGNGKYLVYFDSIADMTTAENLEGHYCLVSKDLLPEGYDKDPSEALTDYRVFDKVSGYVGTVVRIDENPAHPLLVVQDEGEELLVPLVEEFIIEVNEGAQQILLSLPAGLLDLNKHQDS